MITLDAGQVARAEAVLRHIPGGAPKAIANALNRAAEGARTEAVRKVRERYLIRAKDVNETIRVRKASADDHRVIIRSTGTSMALSKFRITPSAPPSKQRKNPIVVRVIKGGGGPVKGAFVARMASSHIGVFHRAGRARLPLVERYGPSVPQMLGHESVTQYIKEQAADRVEKRLDHEIERMLRGVGK